MHGVILDTKLNWKPHIRDTLTRANRRKGMLFNLLKPSCPTTLMTKRLIYLTLIRPILTYATPTWATLSNQLLNNMEVFQNKLLRLITGAPWYVRNSIIANDLDVEPVLVHIQNLALVFYTSASTADNPLIRTLGQTDNLPHKMPVSILSRN